MTWLTRYEPGRNASITGGARFVAVGVRTEEYLRELGVGEEADAEHVGRSGDVGRFRKYVGAGIREFCRDFRPPDIHSDRVSGRKQAVDHRASHLPHTNEPHPKFSHPVPLFRDPTRPVDVRWRWRASPSLTWRRVGRAGSSRQLTIASIQVFELAGATSDVAWKCYEPHPWARTDLDGHLEKFLYLRGWSSVCCSWEWDRTGKHGSARARSGAAT